MGECAWRSGGFSLLTLERGNEWEMNGEWEMFYIFL